MSEIKLKPCPFCGGGAAIGRHGDNYFVECCQCGARTWFYANAKKAAEAWRLYNSRSKWRTVSM